MQLNESIRAQLSLKIYVRPTPLPWLPVFSYITPPHIRRMAATNQLLSKISSSTVTVTLISDIEFHPEVRLTSRRLVWLEEPQEEEVSPWQKWTEEWAASDVVNRSLIVDPFIAPPGFDLYTDACGRRCTNFALARVDVQPTSSAGIRLQIRPVPVAHLHKLCRTLWTIVQILNLIPVVGQSYIWLIRRLLPGSACRAYVKKK